MFGVSFLEIAVVGLVALIVVGPQKLPAMMRTAGEWVGKLRRITSQVRAQTGIDEILREEGIDGVRELRSMLRGQSAMFNNNARSSANYNNSQVTVRPAEPALEFPVEGADCSSALAEDLLSDFDKPLVTELEAPPAVDVPAAVVDTTAVAEPTTPVVQPNVSGGELPALSETESKSAS